MVNSSPKKLSLSTRNESSQEGDDDAAIVIYDCS